MYFVVAGGGEVGFHLAKALLESGHEVMVIESDRRRAAFIEEQLGSVVLNAHATNDSARAKQAPGADGLIDLCTRSSLSRGAHAGPRTR